MEKLFIETPIYASHKLKKEAGKNVFYKMECFQPTGSFKIRGMENLCRAHIEKGAKYFISSSGGNAGYSMAFVGKKLGVKVKVVLPNSTSQFMIEKIEQLDAEVEIFGNVWDEAHLHALEIAEKEGAVYVSPFDDPLLWQGHATMIDECAKQMIQPDKVIVSVGGGGLLCGIFLGMKRNNWKSTEIITTETIGAASFYASWKAKKVVELKKIATIATSLGAKKITSMALDLASQFNVTPTTMDDKTAIESTYLFAKEYNIQVEPACGAALSIPYFRPELIKENENVLVIVCGGVNTTQFS